MSYCSDGTLGDAGVPADGDGTSSCGGVYPVTVEVDDTELPEGAPVNDVSYCSDGTLDGLQP